LSSEEIRLVFLKVDEINKHAPPKASGQADVDGIAANRAHSQKLKAVEEEYATGSPARACHSGYIKALKRHKGEVYRKSCFARARRASENEAAAPGTCR
jgi:hypothetical protein